MVFIFQNKETEIAKLVHKSATVTFILNNTVFTIPLVGISAITLYCADNSPYHTGRTCYDVEHIIYCVMAAIIMILLIVESLIYWFIFYIKNPFSRCYLANPDNLWKIAKVLVKSAPPIYFVIDYTNTLQNVYVFAYLILNGGFFVFFRFLNPTWYNKKHLYFTIIFESIVVWFAIFVVANYYLNQS